LGLGKVKCAINLRGLYRRGAHLPSAGHTWVRVSLERVRVRFVGQMSGGQMSYILAGPLLLLLLLLLPLTATR